MASIAPEAQREKASTEPLPDVIVRFATTTLRLQPSDPDDLEVIRRLKLGAWVTFEGLVTETAQKLKLARDGESGGVIPVLHVKICSIRAEGVLADEGVLTDDRHVRELGLDHALDDVPGFEQ